MRKAASMGWSRQTMSSAFCGTGSSFFLVPKRSEGTLLPRRTQRNTKKDRGTAPGVRSPSCYFLRAPSCPLWLMGCFSFPSCPSLLLSFILENRVVKSVMRVSDEVAQVLEDPDP